MILAQRYADEHTGARYPLDCNRQLPWQSAGNRHSATIDLADVPAGTIVVPSLALLSNEDYRFQFTLTAAERRWSLHPIPCESAPKAESDPAVTTHVDCFHIHQPLNGAQLEIEVSTLQDLPHYLLTVTIRNLELDRIPTPVAAVSCLAPPAISQMSLGKKLGGRVCSPTCTTMLLAMHGKHPELDKVSAACFDPVTKLYGIWPLALRAASRAGCLGAVEVFDDWQTPQQVLTAGLPIITSIRFATGELPGAPLQSTSGHLVVVHGISPEEVLVCDPAAADAAGVPRRYDSDSFGRAWLRHRGAAYILLP